MIRLIGGIITLAILFLRWRIKKGEEDAVVKAQTKLDVSNAIASGDLSRINSVIDRLRQ
jgi:hypothetical protein